MFGPSVGCLFRTYQRTSQKTAAISRHELPALPLLGQQVMVQFAPRWRLVWFQLNARYTHVAAILADKLKALERENRELRQANEILRKASAYFATAELDRRYKP